MKRHFRSGKATLVAAPAALLLAGCDGDGGTAVNPNAPAARLVNRFWDVEAPPGTMLRSA